MQRNFTHLNPHRHILLAVISLVFISCVYFNTFYNAETSFKKAMKIIEESPILDDDELPSQAKKLLGDAIDNSKLVIKTYPDSKYVDDAIFIIAKASFLRNEIAIAESQFKLLLHQYPDSKYYSYSEIWLAYSHFRMGLVDSAQSKINILLERNPKDKEKLYIMHNMLAEISLEKDSIYQVYHHYELAAKFAPSDSKKTSTFGKLVKIAELNLDKERAAIFLEKLGEVAPDKIRIDSKMKWIIYQRELGNYDEIINQIESMLGLSEFAAEYMQLELELGKVYKEKGDISVAKEIFSVMVDNYSKKNETAEAYYHLGFMALIEDFNLDLAKEYFEKSKIEKSQSKYGKESREFINKISRFENLQSLYKELIKNPDEDVEIDRSDFEYENNDTDIKNEIPNNKDRDVQFDDTNSSNQEKYNNLRGQMDFDMSEIQAGTEFMNPNSNLGTASASSDSVLFMIGEMLLYDFNRLELSLEKFKTLVVEYPESNFAPQALYVLSHFEPESDWQMQLKTSFPNSSFLNTASTSTDTLHPTLIEVYRDNAWSLAKNSYEESYDEFNRLFNDELDTLAGYISGFISDYYLNDIELAVSHYQSFTDSFPDHSYTPIIETRLLEIKTDIEDQKEISQQGIDYQAAVMYLHNEHNYDSVKVLLTNITSGVSSPYKDAANNLKSVIRDYKELSEEIIELNVPSGVDSVVVELEMPLQNEELFIDSLYFLLAELFAHDLEFMDSARFYHKKLINSYGDSKFRPLSILFLSEVEPGEQWGDLLNIEYPDSSYNPDSTIHHSVYIRDIFQEDFAAIHENNIALCDIYSEYFLELTTEEPLIEEAGEIEEEKEFPEKVIEPSQSMDPITDISDEPFKEMEIYLEEPGNQIEHFFEPFTELNENNNLDPVEKYIDKNNNQKYDRDEKFIDANNNGQFDPAEPFTDLGNGKYDSGEKFVDLYSNSEWDAQLWYVDKNRNNKWDDGEPFEDLNKDGRKSYGEPYTDRNNNKLYDPPEQINNIKFNYSAVLFSEPFTDQSNGIYDLGESFQDNNGDGIWTPAEEFEDLNGNKIWDAINPKFEKLEDEEEIPEEVLEEKEFMDPIVDVPDELVEEEIPLEEPENQIKIFFEPFTELNENNNWDPAEKYIDKNNNHKYDRAEEFIDTNNNGQFDTAENLTDDNQNGVWDEAEPFTDLGNGKYDSGEKFVDLYSNSEWDAQLWYVDKNRNNKWDDGEPFEDLNKDGRKSYGEPYTDRNNNKLYDPPEQINNIKFNYRAVLFSEPFTDQSNGIYDLGESFQDNNGDGIWTPAEEFEDLNGNKIWDAINPESVKPDSIISPVDSILQPGNEKEIMKP